MTKAHDKLNNALDRLIQTIKKDIAKKKERQKEQLEFLSEADYENYEVNYEKDTR